MHLSADANRKGRAHGQDRILLYYLRPMFTGKIKGAFAVAFFAVIAAFGTAVCLSAKKERPYWQTAPWGTVRIAENLYCDQIVVCNVHYREYLYWIERVFGKNSREYQRALPDTTGWLQFDCLKDYATNYFRRVPYDFYPLVGVSQAQALNFAKWRSDRVFERLLIENNIIAEDPLQNRNTYFSIFRYFKGEYKGIKPSTDYLYYPVYKLPSVTDWHTALAYEDSLERLHGRKCAAPYLGIEPCVNGNLKYEPTQEANKGCVSDRYAPLVNLIGNVAEWSDAYKITLGKGWADKSEPATDTSQLATANVWTGFRNVCYWKKYEAPKQPTGGE